MFFKKSAVFTFAFLAVLAITFANTTESLNTEDASLASADILDTAERVVGFKYYPTRCYRRSQVCCYKYVKCGKICKIKRCFKIRKCVLKAFKKCLKYKVVTICIKRCYAKLCKRVRCSRLRVVKSGRYIVPKPYILAKKYTVKKVEKK